MRRFNSSSCPLSIRVLLGTLGFALFTVLFIATLAINENDRMRRGIESGFSLSGTYVKPIQDGSLLSFGEGPDKGDGWLWWAYDGSEGSRGRIRFTSDPNCYILEEFDGNEIGLVNLAYTKGADEGTLYVRFGEEDFIQMIKINGAVGIRYEGHD